MDLTPRPSRRLKEALLIMAAGLLLFGGLLLIERPPTHEALARDSAARLLIAGAAEGRQALVGSIWWAPLPTLLHVPLVYALPSLPAGTPSLLLAAICAAAVLWLLYRFCRVHLPRGESLYLILTLAVAPGFAEALRHAASLHWNLLVAMILLAGYYGWRREHSLRTLVTIGTAGGLAVVSGVEITVWCIIMFGLLAAHEIGRPAPAAEKRAVLLMATLPALYAAGLWLLMNWLIMGSPWHFLRPASLVLASAAKFDGGPFTPASAVMLWVVGLIVVATLALLKNNPTIACLAVASLAWLWPLAWFGKAGLRDYEITAWLALVLTALAAMSALAGSQVKIRPAARRILCLIPLALMLAVRSLHYAPRHSRAAMAIDQPELRQACIQGVTARVTAGREPYVKVLASGYDALALLSAYEGRLLWPVLDLNLHQAVNAYPGYRLYLLIGKPSGTAALDIANVRYPELYRRGGPFLLHAGDWGPWRLYEFTDLDR